MSNKRVLKPEQWPYRPHYTAMCENAMEEMGVPPDKREDMMRQMTQAHGDPLRHLNALRVAIHWDGRPYNGSGKAGR